MGRILWHGVMIFAKDPINYAKSQIKLANDHRAKILDEFVKDGESWAKAR